MIYRDAIRTRKNDCYYVNIKRRGCPSYALIYGLAHLCLVLGVFSERKT